MMNYVLRDESGRFLGRSRSAAAAHRASRSRNRVGSTVSANRAGVEVGMTAFGSRGLKVHHYRGSVRITDMTNAGKRGKKVRELTIVSKSHDDAETERVFANIIDQILHVDYDAAKRHLEELARDFSSFASTFRGFDIHEQILRGVDVEPPATKINLEKRHDDGEIVTISASPHDFHVRSSVLIHAPGKVAHGYRQDTSYWPAGSAAQKRRSAGAFYDWLRQNLQAASQMTIRDLTAVWDALGIGYDSH